MIITLNPHPLPPTHPIWAMGQIVNLWAVIVQHDCGEGKKKDSHTFVFPH